MLTPRRNLKIDDAVCQVVLSGKEISIGRLQMMLSDIPLWAIERRLAEWGQQDIAPDAGENEETRELLSALLNATKGKFEANAMVAGLTALMDGLKAKNEASTLPYRDFNEHWESLTEASNAESAKELLAEYLPKIEARIPNFLQLCVDDPEALARYVGAVKPTRRKPAFRP